MGTGAGKESRSIKRSLLPDGVKEPYDWALTQMRIRDAHKITRGSRDVVVAVIDLGYRFHPEHEGHLWVNPHPTRGDTHGWDFAEDDASLEFEGPGADTEYSRSHHAFVVGEVAAVAPECPIMILRVGYESHHKKSWELAVRYAVNHGARILIIPHGYLTLNPDTGEPLFHQGTDFTYPAENVGLLKAFDDAYRSGCLIFKGTADNRGREVATVNAAVDSVIAVGSTNRLGLPANIAASAEYVEVAAPGGDRDSDNILDNVWGTGGAENYIPFTGGCMAAGFAGGVGALVASRFPTLSNEQMRQLLRNTAADKGCQAQLGHGILDAYQATSLEDERVSSGLHIRSDQSVIRQQDESAMVADIGVENTGALDIKRMLVVVYNGNPLIPADSTANRHQANILLHRQVGHSIAAAPGLNVAQVRVELDSFQPEKDYHVQVCAMDVGSTGIYDTAAIRSC